MKILENATLTPVKRHAGKIGRLKVGRVLTRYGLHDQTGTAFREWPILISLKSTFPYHARRPPAEIDRVIEEPVIYAGLIFGRFGHFITESLPNLLAVAEAKRLYPEARILAHTERDIDPLAWKEEHAGHLSYFFDKIGLDLEELDFVLTPTRARTLIVPEAPFTGRFSYKPWVLRAIDALWPAPTNTRPIYFSRSRYSRNQRIENESAIEAIFASRGFDIIHPQEHGLDEQIAIVRAARVIAGPQGTALHWSLYAPMCRAVFSLGYGSPLQNGICRSCGQEYIENHGRRPRGGAHRLRRIDFDEINSTLDQLGQYRKTQAEVSWPKTLPHSAQRRRQIS